MRRLSLAGIFLLLVFCLPAGSSFSARSALAAKIVLIAGGGELGDGALAVQARLGTPFGAAFDRSGRMYVAEYSGHRIRVVDREGRISTLCGSGVEGYGGDGGPLAGAQFRGMHALVVSERGDLYVADTFNQCVRKIDVAGETISTFAGTGEKGFSGDGGPANKATFGGIYCLDFNSRQTRLYLVDLDNRRIRRVDMATGVVETFAGNGQQGVPADGALAKEVPLVDPRAVAVDAEENVYILERGGHALRVVNSAGRIRTIAGTGQLGHEGDGGDARGAKFNGPKHLCVDRQGNVLIADTENHLIRKVLPREGKIIRIAGTGRQGAAGLGGDPLSAELSQPHGVYVRDDGAIFISDSSNQRVLKIEN